MKPLAELAPDHIHPVLGLTAERIAGELNDEGIVREVVVDWNPPSSKGVIPSVHFRDFTSDLLSTCGGVIVRNVLDPKKVGGWYSAADELFRLGTETLSRHARVPPGRLGYTPPGVESVRYAGPNRMRHFFDFAPGMNVPIGFGSVMTGAWTGLYEVARGVLGEISSSGQWLTSIAHGGAHHLRSAQYLNECADPLAVLFPAHFDWSLVTLFVGGAKSGLAVQSGVRWYGVEIPSDAVLVGAGTMLKLYRPDIPPLRHRVIADATGRVSLFFFTEPPFGTVLPNGELVKNMIARLEKETRH